MFRYHQTSVEQILPFLGHWRHSRDPDRQDPCMPGLMCYRRARDIIQVNTLKEQVIPRSSIQKLKRMIQ